jgi:hypothetical protein
VVVNKLVSVGSAVEAVVIPISVVDPVPVALPMIPVPVDNEDVVVIELVSVELDSAPNVEVVKPISVVEDDSRTGSV